MRRMIVMLMAIIPLVGGCIPRKVLIKPTRATLGYKTAIHDDLVSLPPPEGKICVAVYRFRDQTGQYKYRPDVVTYSTAVTQGATSMLIKALEDSGWFIPVEREGFENLLNERRIREVTKKEPPLPPLMDASIMLEGGIIAYDTNIITGGFGARYFGIGGSTRFQRDTVTIYLRAIDIRDGRIIKSVRTSKTILSKRVDFGVYKFVRLRRLLEVETGYSTNEPVEMCVLEAIEKAVYSLIIEGILDGLWLLKNPEDIKSPAIQRYLKEKEVGKVISFDNKGNLVKVKTGMAN